MGFEREIQQSGSRITNSWMRGFNLPVLAESLIQKTWSREEWTEPGWEAGRVLSWTRGWDLCGLIGNGEAWLLRHPCPSVKLPSGREHNTRETWKSQKVYSWNKNIFFLTLRKWKNGQTWEQNFSSYQLPMVVWFPYSQHLSWYL